MSAGRPIVGIACDVRREARPLHFVFEPYVRRVEEAGGLPLLLPPLDAARAAEALSRFDAVVFPGGEDLDPALYGEEPLGTHDPLPAEREAFDLAVARALLAGRKPVLGICYGCQLLAVASGGALWQHIPSQVDGALEHAGKWPDLPEHPIEVTAGTRLHALLGSRPTVNSAHHQAPKRLGDGLVVSAVAPDGVIEAFEAEGDRFLVAVGWHPELMSAPEQRRLFEALVDAAR